MRREFNQNIIILLLLNGIVKPLYLFGVETRVQNLVGIDAYGYYFALLDFVFLFLFINDPGIQGYNAKHVAQNRDAVSTYFSRLLGTKMMLGAAFGILTLLVGHWIGYPASYLLVGLLTFSWMSSLFVIMRGTMAGIGSYKTDSILSSIDKLLMLLVIGSIVWFSPYQDSFDMSMYVWLQLTCTGVGVIIFGILLVKKGALSFPRFDLEFSQRVIKQSLPFALIILLTSIFTRIDGVMIERMLPNGAEQAGAYAASYRFIDAGNMLGFLFGGLLLSMYSTLLGSKKDVQSLFESSYAQLLIIGTTVSAICICFSQDLFGFIYTDEYQPYHSLLQVLMISFIPVTVTHSMGSLMQASGSLRALNYLLVVAVLANVVGNYIAIPAMGAIGAAATSVGTQFLIFFGLIILLVNKKIIRPEYSQLVKTLLYIACTFGVAYFISNGDLHWMIETILVGLLSLATGAALFGQKIWSRHAVSAEGTT